MAFEVRVGRTTVEPRFNEVPRDWTNWFAISRVRYIEALFHTLRYYWDVNIVRCTEDFVNRGSLNRGYTVLEMSQVNEDTTTKWCVSTSVYCWD